MFPVSKHSNQITNSIFLNKSKKVRTIKTNKNLENSYYNDSGQFYLAYLKTWKKHKNIHKNGICIEIPEWRTVDINYPSDWKKAEAISRYIKYVSR